MFWEIYRFTKDYTPKNMNHVTFAKDNEIVLVHKDTKYEHEFYHEKFRWVIKLDHNVFKDWTLQLVPNMQYIPITISSLTWLKKYFNKNNSYE